LNPTDAHLSLAVHASWLSETAKRLLPNHTELQKLEMSFFETKKLAALMNSKREPTEAEMRRLMAAHPKVKRELRQLKDHAGMAWRSFCEHPHDPWVAVALLVIAESLLFLAMDIVTHFLTHDALDKERKAVDHVIMHLVTELRAGLEPSPPEKLDFCSR
jgi:hypothetical protein